MGHFNRLPWLLALLLVVTVLGLLLVECDGDERTVPAQREDAEAETRGVALLRGNDGAPSEDATADPVDVGETPIASQSDEFKVVRTPPGTLEFQFFRGTEPISRARALLWRKNPRRYYNFAKPPDRESALDADGVVRFTDLDSGKWAPGLRLPGGTVISFNYQAVRDHRTRQRIVLRLGTAAVYGVVFRDNGDPADGALVWMHSLAKMQVRMHTRTDALGRYRLPHVQAGRAELRMVLPGAAFDRHWAPAHRKRTSLPDDDDREINWGSPNGRALLQGRVLCEDGEPVCGPATIVLEGKRHVSTLFVEYNAQGAFRRRIDPDVYRITLQTAVHGGPRKTFDLDVSEDHADLRWTIPGARVLGRVAFEDGSPLSVHGQVYMDDLPGRWSPMRARAVRIRDGGYRFDGVAVGKYRVRVKLTKDDWREASNIVIEAAMPELRLDVTLAPKK